MSLYKKLLEVQKAVSSIPKRGYNSFHKYHYATEADILSIKETLNDNGLMILPTTIHQETGFKPDGKSWASVTIRFRVCDENGESIESEFTGYAEDSFDKAIYKATTGANKYFYLKFFGVATDDDPENEQQSQQQPKQRQPWPPKKQERPVREPVEIGVAAKNRALVAANKILALQKQAGLANEEVLYRGEIDSIRELAELSDYQTLEAAYERIKSYTIKQAAY